MTRKNPARTALPLSALALLISGALYAGPLTPPAGPVTSTYKTLTEVEPRIAINATNTPGDANSVYRITQSGSYYLTENVIGAERVHGIEIAANSVVLDLRGFAVISSGIGLDGISTDGVSRVSITVRDGVVSAWGTGGIDLDGTGHIIESVHARVNQGVGISAGTAAIIRGSQASGNSGSGFSVLDGSSISDCVASGNTANGFLVTEGCTLTNCVAKGNGAIGIDSGGGCVITGCSANDNAGIGIRSTDSGLDDGGTSISNSSASGNGGDGISAGLGGLVSGCAARRNTGVGITVGVGGSAINSTAAFNLGGFAGSIGSTFNGCTAFNNSTFGFNLEAASTITNCTARSNGQDGIAATGGCTILNNTCSNNGPTPAGGSGIVVQSGDNRIEGNNCTGNDDFGIEVVAPGNIIVRNTCSGNGTNWSIASNNYYGPIINRVGVATVAQVGNGSGADALASTHPNANISY